MLPNATQPIGPRIQATLTEHPDGFSTSELMALAGLRAERTTVYRHLMTLVRNGQVERIGAGRATRYRAFGIERIRAYLAVPYTRRVSESVSR